MSIPEHDSTFSRWRHDALAATESALERALPPAGTHPARLHEAMRYAVLGGGKRIRPLLVHAAAEAACPVESGTDPRVAELVGAAAAAVELIHAYSLVHDDMPCMDDDTLRRGRATVHVAYDEATAMLVGDGLQALAFEALASALVRLPAAPAAKMIAGLAAAAGSAGMVGGQAIDLAAVGQKLTLPALEEMHRRKTGALIAASIRLGWLAGNVDRAAPPEREAAALSSHAAAIGLAFQVVDDVLDVEGETSTLGKTAGKDAAQDKPTYVAALGLAGAKARAAALYDEAIGALAVFGARGDRLRALADLIARRES